jgi:hypothetical protein
MELTDQRRTSATWFPGKEPQVPIEQGALWALKLGRAAL